MSKARAFAVFGVAVLIAAWSLAQPPAARADGAAYFQTEVRFADGSAVVTSLNDNSVTTTPADDGSPGAAEVASAIGSVTTNDVSAAPADVSAALAEASSDTTVAAGDPEPLPEPNPTADDVTVTPLNATPDGFHLYGTNTTAYGYIYTSQYLATYLNRCIDGSCTHIGQVNNRFKEYLYGGSSRIWRLTPNVVYTSGPAYNDQFYYWCGVNIPKASDVTCGTDDTTADYSGVGPYELASESIGNNSYPIYKNFGSGHAQYAKFPMIELVTSWLGYSVKVTEKFRGWDIRNYNNVWKMSPVSGTGY